MPRESAMKPFGHLKPVALIAMAIVAGVWQSSARAADGDLKLVRATLSRSLSAPFIWGFNPIGE